VSSAWVAYAEKKRTNKNEGAINNSFIFN
jgi:hypothetical protein